jgi:hypothetical protein
MTDRIIYPIANGNHEIKWVHNNPGSNWKGTARIEEVKIQRIVSFTKQLFEPITGLSNRKYNFEVNVQSDLPSFEVKLFIQSPNIYDKETQSYGQMYRGNSALEWNNISLNCSDNGESKYWFAAYVPGIIEPIESKKLPGPYITYCIRDESVYGPSEDKYIISLKGYDKAIVGLHLSDESIENWTQYVESKNYVKNESFEKFCWTVEKRWLYHRFEIRDSRGE